MDTALPQKFPFVLEKNLEKAKCTGNRVCRSCDIVVPGYNKTPIRATEKFKTLAVLPSLLGYNPKLASTMHSIGRVTMLFANNFLMECLITMKFLHIFFYTLT